MSEIALQPMKWSVLPHIDDVQPLNDADSAVLEEIRDVLVRRGYVDRFGVCLLHKHFDLTEDEYVLEETDEARRVQTLVVKQGMTPDQGTIQTMWRFTREGTRSVTKCVLRCNWFLGHKQKHVKEGH